MSTWGVNAGRTTYIPGVDDIGELKTPEEEAAELVKALEVAAAVDAALMVCADAVAAAGLALQDALDAIAKEEAYIGVLDPPPFAELSPFYANKCLRKRRRRQLEQHVFVGYRRQTRRARTPYLSSPVFRRNSGIPSRFETETKDRVAARRDVGLSSVAQRRLRPPSSGGSLTRSPRATSRNFVKPHFATDRFYLKHAAMGSDPWDRSNPSNAPSRGGRSGGSTQPHRIHRVGGMGKRALHHQRIGEQRRLRCELKADMKEVAKKKVRVEKCRKIYARMNPQENTLEEEEEMKDLIDGLAADIERLGLGIERKTDLLGAKAKGDEDIDELAGSLHRLLVAERRTPAQAVAACAANLGPGRYTPRHESDITVKRPDWASSFRASKVASGIQFATNENPSPAAYDARHARWFGGSATALAGRGDAEGDACAARAAQVTVTNGGVTFAQTKRRLEANVPVAEEGGSDMLGSALPSNWKRGVASVSAVRTTMIDAPLSCLPAQTAPLTDKYYVEHTPWIAPDEDAAAATVHTASVASLASEGTPSARDATRHAAELKLQLPGENTGFGSSTARPFMQSAPVGAAPAEPRHVEDADVRWPKVHDPRRSSAAFRDASQRRKWVNRRAVNTMIEFHQPPRKDIDPHVWNVKGGAKFPLGGEFDRCGDFAPDPEVQRLRLQLWHAP